MVKTKLDLLSEIWSKTKILDQTLVQASLCSVLALVLDQSLV